MSQMDGTKKKIGDHTYEVFMLPAMQSHRLLVDVVKMIGPSLGPLLDTLTGGGRDSVKAVLDGEVPADLFTKVLGGLLGDLNQEVLDRVIDALSDQTIIEGKGKLRPQLDVHFAGRLDELYKWLAFAVTVQWGKSFGALISALPDQGASPVKAVPEAKG